MGTYRPFDVVVVPFPFTDQKQAKRRPALVLSSLEFGKKISHSVMAMITSAQNAPWPLDVRVGHLKEAGLPAPSVVRMKLFTLDHRLILEQVGTLSEADKKAVSRNIKQLFSA